jgi:oxygen-independent coproporphyrinogen III oxidase
VINEIMCNEYVSFKETAEKFNTSKEEIKNVLNFDEKMFSGFVADHLLKIDGQENFQLTETGRFFIRNIAAQFDPNLQKETKRFSKAL